MIISDKVSYRTINLKTNLSNIEAKWIILKESSIYICGFYSSSGFCKLDNFLDYFCECMNKLKGKKVIWIVDINFDQNKIISPEYRKLESIIKYFNMVQTIQNYTRIARKEKSLLIAPLM